jgi:hypothetical protein
MNDRTQNPAPEMTFEQLWALFQENAQQQKETDRMMKENAQQMKAQREDFDRRQKKTGCEIKTVNQAIGNLGNRLSSLIEHIVSPNMHRKFNALGYTFTQPNTCVAFRDADDETPACGRRAA